MRETETQERALKLTAMQRAYVWLAGAHPDKICVQGHGYRTAALKYGIDGDELVLFGYSEPFLWLQRRGVFRKLANANAFVLTEIGEAEYRRLLLSGAGFEINQRLQLVQVRAR